MNQLNVSSLNSLLECNETFIKEFKRSPLMNLINGDKVKEQEIRTNMLDCIQTFSNHFQNVVMLRKITSAHTRAASAASDHLEEEYKHNDILMRDRSYRAPTWDPILESTSCWFTWKMLTADNIEKTVLMHLVLEASADVFFTAANKVMRYYGETEYFGIHATVDQHHATMGNELLANLSAQEYQRLYEILKQGWLVLIAACNRIAALSVSNKTVYEDKKEDLLVF